jgi:hypothetical protein
MAKLILAKHTYSPRKIREHAEKFSRPIFEKKIRQFVKGCL